MRCRRHYFRRRPNAEEHPLQIELFPERLVTEAERRQVRHDVLDQRRILVETIRAHTKRRLAEIAPNDTGHGAIRRGHKAKEGHPVGGNPLFLCPKSKPPWTGGPLIGDRILSTGDIANSRCRRKGRKGQLLLSPRDQARVAQLTPEAQDLLASVRYRDTVALTKRRQCVSKFVRKFEDELIARGDAGVSRRGAGDVGRARIKLLDARGILLIFRLATEHPYWRLALAIAGIDLLDLPEGG
jgi:hypothetical protein